MSANGLFPAMDLDHAKGRIKQATKQALDKAGIPNEPGEKPYGPFAVFLRVVLFLIIVSASACLGAGILHVWEDRTGVNTFTKAAQDLYSRGKHEESQVMLEMGNQCPDSGYSEISCTLLREKLKKL